MPGTPTSCVSSLTDRPAADRADALQSGLLDGTRRPRVWWAPLITSRVAERTAVPHPSYFHRPVWVANEDSPSYARLAG